MIKRETFQLLKQMTVYYDQFVVDQEKVNRWHDVLKEYSFEQVEGNLLKFVKESNFPPKLADLLPKPESSSTIPNSEETRKIIYHQSVQASEEVKQRELKKIRVILGIVRGEGQ